MRCGVLIGDSIAAGHPGRGSRLKHDGVCAFDPEYPNLPGQLSFHLEESTGMPWFNHGIGSQTTGQIWARWQRDVLAEATDPGDGLGSRTLSHPPCAVVVIAGINDVFQSVDPKTTIRNLQEMAKSVSDHQLDGVFLNLPPHNLATAEQLRVIGYINHWMLQALPSYGILLVDFYQWAENPLVPSTVKPELFVDYVHPSMTGYGRLAGHITEVTGWHKIS